MSLSIASHDSLPYIERAPTSAELTKITALIAKELPDDHASKPHPSLPPPYEPAFTPPFAQELERIASGKPLTGGVDLSRYEPPVGASEENLKLAFAASEHLSSRLTNLSLLSEFGKNAWLVHNAQLEDLLKRMEEELMTLKTQVEVTNKERKGAQKEVEDELRRLEERWKRGVGRVLEVEVAVEAARREAIQRQRIGADKS